MRDDEQLVQAVCEVLGPGAERQVSEVVDRFLIDAGERELVELRRDANWLKRVEAPGMVRYRRLLCERLVNRFGRGGVQ